MSKLQFFGAQLCRLFCLTLIISALACKSDAPETDGPQETIAEESSASTPDNKDTSLSSDPVKKVGEYDPNNYDGFLLGRFKYDIAVDAMVDEPITELKGQIIQFEKDYSYKVFKDSKELERGKFTYERNGQVLTLEATKGLSSQWKVNYQEGMMIWVGTHVYGNNARQIRLYEVKG
jgi:hypothetical protein